MRPTSLRCPGWASRRCGRSGVCCVGRRRRLGCVATRWELAVAWQLQANELGGLSTASTRRLSDLAEQLTSGSAMLPARRVALKPGARLVRQWGGETHEVVVVEGGFVWSDRRWASLSAIARKITGARWSGPRFFGWVQRAAGCAVVGAAETGEGAGATG